MTNRLILVTMFALFALFQWFVPLGMDDYQFMSLYLDHNLGDPSFSWQALWDTAAEVRFGDNGRLANILCPVFTLHIPRWVVVLLTACMVTAMYYLGARLSAPGGFRPRVTPPVLLLFFVVGLVVIPLRNMAWLIDFHLNYTYSSVLTLLFLMFLARGASGTLNGLLLALGMVVGILAGWFQEGFALPVAGALGCWALWRRFRLSRQWWALVVPFGLAILWTLTSPGTWARFQRQGFVLTPFEMSQALVLYLPVVIVLTGALAWFAWKHRAMLAELLVNQTFFLCVAATYMSTLLSMSVATHSRVGWAAELLGMVALFMMYRELWGQRRGNRTLIRRLCWLCLFCVVAEMGYCIRVQYRYYLEDRELLARVAESPDGAIVYDLYNWHKEKRWLMLWKPILTNWDRLSYTNSAYRHYLESGSDKKNFSITPTYLVNFDEEALRPVAGTANLYLTKDGHFVSTRDNSPFPIDEKGALDIYYSQGEPQKAILVCNWNFTSPSGRQWISYEPVYSDLRDPQGIERVDVTTERLSRVWHRK